MRPLAVWGLSDCRHRGVRGSTLLRAGLDLSSPRSWLYLPRWWHHCMAGGGWYHSRLTVSLPTGQTKRGGILSWGPSLCPGGLLPLFAPSPHWLMTGVAGSWESSDEPLWADTHLQAANLCSWKLVVELREEEGLPWEERRSAGAFPGPHHWGPAPKPLGSPELSSKTIPQPSVLTLSPTSFAIKRLYSKRRIKI